MRSKFRLISAFLSAIIIFIIFLCAFQTSAETPSGSVTVLATSDVHGAVFGWDYNNGIPDDVGLAKVSTLVNRERKAARNVVLLDAGDYIQGTPLDSYCSTVDTGWKIHPMILVHNLMKYDAVVLGNHEFNFGLDYLKRAIAPEKAAVLSANTRLASNGKIWPAVRPWTIKDFTINGKRLRMGIIGVTTPAIPNFESPQNFEGITFAPQALMVNRSITELRKKGADSIIVVTHSGVESPRRRFPESGVIDLVTNCPGIDLIISGHDHLRIDNQNPVMDIDRVVFPKAIINGKVPLMSPKCAGEYLSKAVMTFSEINGRWHCTGITTSNISVKGVEEDPVITDAVKDVHAATLNHLRTKIGTATGEFPGAEGDKKETALVDLINRVQIYYAKSDLSAAPCFNDSAVIHCGDITYQNIFSLYPFENYICTIRISGAQLRKYLEKAAEYFKQSPLAGPVVSSGIPSYNFDTVNGAYYLIDVTKPAGSRIRDLEVKGKPVKDDDRFTLSINNYRFSGGGGYMAAMGFSKEVRPVVVWDSQKFYGDNGRVRNLIAEYIKMKKSISPDLDNNWRITTSPE